MLVQPAVATLNHLLAQSGWALPRLARFTGRTARFNIAPFTFACTIQDDGMLHETLPSATADASCHIPPSLLPRLALQDASAFDQIECSGDAALIEEILFLARHLRWDAAEDLSRFTGDIAAERIVRFAKDIHRQARDTVLNLAQALTEYWTEERPLLAKPQQVAAFVLDVNRLREEVARLEQRIGTLSPPSTGSGQTKPSPASGRREH
ncbi:MAG: SCP2 domain-containing protein [Gallionellaceae bacterium]